MSHQNHSWHEDISKLFKTIGSYLLGASTFLLAFITTIFELSKRYEENKNLALAIGFFIVLIFMTLTSIYIFFSRKSKGLSESNQNPIYVPKYKRWIRLTSIFFLSIVWLISAYYLWRTFTKEESIADKITILVAEFDGPKSDEYDINWTISNELKRAAESCDFINVKEDSSIVRNEAEATKTGIDNNASIVIWGSYRKTEDTKDIPVSVHFDPVGLALQNSPFEVGPEAKGAIRRIPSESFSNLEFELLVKDLSFLSLFAIGTACQMANNPDAALSLYALAYAQVEQHPEVFPIKSSYYFLGKTYASKGEHQLAIDNFSNAIESANGYFPEAHLSRGISYLSNGNVSASIQDFDKALGDGLVSPEVYLGLGLAHYTLGAYSEALENFSNALNVFDKDSGLSKEIFKNASLLHNYALVNFYIADSYLAMNDKESASGNFESIVSVYKKALRSKLAKDDAEKANFYNNIGYAFFLDGNKAEAIAFYEKAIKVNPSFITAYLNRAAAYRFRGNYIGVFADYKKVLELDADNLSAYLGRAEAYGDNLTRYNSRFANNMVDDYSRVIEIDPKNHYAYSQRAQAHYQKAIRITRKWEDLDLAIQDISTAIELYSEQPDYYFRRGQLYWSMNGFLKDSGAVSDAEIYADYATQDLRKVIEISRNPIQLKDAQELLDDIQNKNSNLLDALQSIP